MACLHFTPCIDPYIYRSIHSDVSSCVTVPLTGLACINISIYNNYFNSLTWTNTFKVAFTDARGTLDMTEHDT